MILAPMQGLTEVLFRKAYEECFPGAIMQSVSPFLSLTHGHLADAWKKVDDVLPEVNEGSMPVVPQILGKELEEFVELANRLNELGYDEVNWNMGCPMRKVTAKHRGSGILPYPDEVRGILDYVVPRMKCRLSVKMRLGLKSSEEIFRLIPILNEYPLASVIIHPRLGRQQYNGVPDWDCFGEVLKEVRHRVIGNGDIVTATGAAQLRKRFPDMADIMIGRGVLYDPLLPLAIEGRMPEEALEQHAERVRFVKHLMVAIKATMPTEQSRIRKTKEYWCLVWKALNISEVQAREVLRQNDIEAVDKMIEKYLQ